MKILVFLVSCALVVRSSWCEGIFMIGSKFIRPNRPYTVAFANPLNKNVKLNLTLECADSGEEVLKKESTLQLGRLSGKNFLFSVPSIPHTSDCIFLAINDGGDVIVNHDTDLRIPEKTVSIFIQTDRPVYNPGDDLRFRVVVVDIDTKPVTNIKTIEVLIKDVNNKSVIRWTSAKLNKGIFEASYQMAAEPVLGTWIIIVTVDDNAILNEKIQPFEVMEYVLPKFAVKAWPSKTLLIKDKRINLDVESHYTSGQRVEGKVRVNLYLDQYSRRSSHEAVQNINGNTVVEFRLKEELDVEYEEDHTLVNMTAAVTDSLTNDTVNITQLIPVYMTPYKISLVKHSMYYRPGAPYHFKVSVKDHTGLPLEQGKMLKITVDDEEKSAPLDGQGLASFIIETPDDGDSITVSAEFDSVEYDNIGTIEGLERISTQYLQIHSKQRIIAGRPSSFSISSNEPIIQFWYFVVTRGSIVDFGHINTGVKKTYTMKLKLTQAMAPKATLVVFIDEEGQFIADYLNLNFESFSCDFQASTHQYGLTKQGILDDLDQYNGMETDNALDWFDSKGLFYRGDSDPGALGSSRAKRFPFYQPIRAAKR